MDGKDVINVMEKDVHSLKEKGIVSVPTDNLLKYIEELKGLDRDNISSEEHGRNFQAFLAEYKAKTDLSIAMLDSVITIGQGALKSAVIINGGASVALLAFIGHVWSRLESSLALRYLALSLVAFAFGVISATIAWSFTYFTQREYAMGNDSIANIINGIVIAFVFFSYGCFIAGIINTYILLNP